jgi:hypothetical protein
MSFDAITRLIEQQHLRHTPVPLRLVSSTK